MSSPLAFSTWMPAETLILHFSSVARYFAAHRTTSSSLCPRAQSTLTVAPRFSCPLIPDSLQPSATAPTWPRSPPTNDHAVICTAVNGLKFNLIFTMRRNDNMISIHAHGSSPLRKFPREGTWYFFLYASEVLSASGKRRPCPDIIRPSENETTAAKIFSNKIYLVHNSLNTPRHGRSQGPYL